MTQVCTICASPHRADIDRGLIRGESMRSLAARYGTGRESIRRHRQDHLSELLLRAYDADEQARAGGLLADIERIRASAFDLLDHAERAHDWRARVAAIRECRENVRILGELHGSLEASRANVQINLVTSAEWVALKGVIITALREHPGALEAVSQAIRRKELTNGAG
jgi:hypothetical protein